MTKPSVSTTPDPLPPDRRHVLTERPNQRTRGLHTLNVAECVKLIVHEDHAVLKAVESARPALTRFIDAAAQRFIDVGHPGSATENLGGRLIYIGAGTSGRLGVLDASEAPPTFQVPPGRIIGIIAGGDRALRLSSEGKEDDPAGAAADFAALGLTPTDTVLGIAAGGTTPYVLGALTLAKRLTARACLTGLLSCSPVTKPADADHLIVLPTGPEVLTGSTRMKAGSATKMALNIISTTLMVQRGRVYENLMVDLRATNQKLRDRAARIVSTITGAERTAAFQALDAAEGLVKVAIVMISRTENADSARQILQAAAGRLDAVLSPRPPRLPRPPLGKKAAPARRPAARSKAPVAKRSPVAKKSKAPKPKPRTRP